MIERRSKYKTQIIRILVIMVLIFINFRNHIPQISEELDNEIEISLSNIEQFEFEQSIITIGTTRKYYVKGETISIYIKNLPDQNYVIKLDGREEELIDSLGTWKSEVKPRSIGTRRNNIRIFNSIGDLILDEYVEYHVSNNLPVIESQFGRCLIRGVYNEIDIKNLNYHGYSIKVSAVGGKMRRNRNSGFEVLPDLDVNEVKLDLISLGNETSKIFPVVDPPIPELVVRKYDDMTCFDLKTHPMLGEVKFRIVKMLVKNSSNMDELNSTDSSCLIDHEKSLPYQIVYELVDSDYVDTLQIQ